MFWVSVQTFSELFHYKESRTRMNKRHPRVFMSNSDFYCQIYTKIEFFLRCSKIFKYQVSWNSVHAYKDGRADLTKLIVAFRKLTQLIRSHFSSFLAKCDVTNTAVICIECIKVFRVFICISVISCSPFVSQTAVVSARKLISAELNWNWIVNFTSLLTNFSISLYSCTIHSTVYSQLSFPSTNPVQLN